jgi:hypothetical protein
MPALPQKTASTPQRTQRTQRPPASHHQSLRRDQSVFLLAQMYHVICREIKDLMIISLGRGRARTSGYLPIGDRQQWLEFEMERENTNMFRRVTELMRGHYPGTAVAERVNANPERDLGGFWLGLNASAAQRVRPDRVPCNPTNHSVTSLYLLA